MTRATNAQMATSFNPIANPPAADEPIPAGDIRFYNNYLPLLDAGTYTLSVHQDIESTDAKHPLSQQADTSQEFDVIAPRFALDPSEVQSVFPPGNSVGPFDQNLPHVVLMQRALPWERELGPNLMPPIGSDIKVYPWLALLLFTDDELPVPASTTPGDNTKNPTRVTTRPVSQLLTTGDATILGPPVTANREDETTCTTIDISTALFTQVTPRLGDIGFLAHARQVNVDQKTTSLAMTSGWFSVVTGNRFPQIKDPAGTRQIAHLVSLEGFAPYLVDSPQWPTGVATVRLASLASWTYIAQSEGANFRELMENLVKPSAPGGNGLRLQLPVPRATTPLTPDSPEDLTRRALNQGYAPLEYQTRVGDQTFSWYHGPFVPHPVPPLAAGTAFASAAAAMIYDATSGTFDLSYAASWEIGRLLALSDGAYSLNQQRTRKSLRTLVNLVRERLRWSPPPSLAATAEAGAQQLAEIVKPQSVSRSVGSWIAANVGTHMKAAPATSAMPTPRKAFAAPAPRLGAVAGVASLLGRADVRQLVTSRVQQMASSGPMYTVVDWLSGLRLLEGVPFVHLVPDARMLPVESIRFFYVDPNALDAMCDGAQSVGVQTTRDANQQQVTRSAVKQLSTQRANRRRANLLRRVGPPPVAATNAQANDPVAGFLLRSAAVSGWPGLEIQAFLDVAGTQPIDAVRIDHVAADVLLVLYPKVPARVDINEPKEGLAFGVEDDWIVDIRSIYGTNIGEVIGKVTLDATYRRDNGVLLVSAWQKFLKQKLGDLQTSNPPALWGAAAFAIQMVRAPEQMTFDNGAST